MPPLSEARALLAAVVESSDDAIITKTLGGVITSWNRAAERMFGYAAEEAIGREIMLIIPPDLRDQEREILQRLSRGEWIEHFETTRLARSGERLEVSLTISPVRDTQGRIVGASKVARDISQRMRADAALRESEERFRALATNAPAAIFIKDLAGRYTTANPPACEALGREGVVGLTDHELLPAEIADALRAHDREVIETRRAIELEEVVSRPGLERWYLSVKFPLFGADGEPSGVGAVAIDVTDRRRAEEARRESDARFRTLADHIAQLAWMADAQGSVFWYNERWFEYTGTTLEEMQGWGWKHVQHPDHVERVVARIQRCMETGAVLEDTFPLRGRDGSYRWFLTRAVPIRDAHGNVLRWFGTNTDVTEQREAEEALREADRRKDEFLALLAHEIRNPLAPLRSSLDVLSQEAGDRESERKARGLMDRQLAHLERLVDDLLDVSRITRDKLLLRKQPLELCEQVRQAAAAVAPLAERSGHRLEVSLPAEPVPFVADAVRLAQVLGNLLENACKHAGPGGRIWLAARREGDEVVISVRDEGAGIAPEQLPRIFEMFTQLEPSVSRGGLGIGLTLVQRLVALHGGSVCAYSEGEGRGSEFVVRLPIQTGEALPAAPPARPARAGGTRRRILIVDDNADAAEALSMLLSIRGHETHVACDGESGLKAAAELRPEVSFLDIGLPGISGLEVARRIREQPWGTGMVLVALTGWGQSEDRRRSREVGFDHHLVKPVPHEALVRLFDSLERAPGGG